MEKDKKVAYVLYMTAEERQLLKINATKEHKTIKDYILDRTIK